MQQQTAICTKTTDMGNLIFIEYKINRHIYTIGIPVDDADFQIAKSLKKGDKFIIESINIELNTTKQVQIPNGTIDTLKYIVKKITR